MRWAVGIAISVRALSPRRPPESRRGPTSTRRVPSVPKIHASLAGPSPVTELKRRCAMAPLPISARIRSEEHTSELQSLRHLVCRLLLEKKDEIDRSISDTTEHD